MLTRYHAEERYYKELEGSIKKVPQPQLTGSLALAASDCRENITQLAHQHQQTVQSFKDIVTELDKTIRDVKTIKTKQQDNYIKLTREQENKKSSHLKAKQHYEDSVRKAENSTLQLAVQKTRQQEKVIKKAESVVADAIKEQEKNHKIYIKAVTECQNTQSKYENEVATIQRQFEELERNRLRIMNEIIQKYVSIQESEKQFHDKQLSFQQKTAQSTDVEKDLLSFIQTTYTGTIPEQHVEYRPRVSDVIPHYADPVALQESHDHMMQQQSIHEKMLQNSGPEALSILRQKYAMSTYSSYNSDTTNQQKNALTQKSIGMNQTSSQSTIDDTAKCFNTNTSLGINAVNIDTTIGGKNDPNKKYPSQQQNTNGSINQNINSNITKNTQKYARSQYAFKGQQEGDLSFLSGDIINLIMYNPEEEWWCGNIGNETGIFPRVYVEILPDEDVLGLDTPTIQKKYNVGNKSIDNDGGVLVIKQVKAMYDFKGTDKDELSFSVGEILKVYSETDGWYGGENSKGVRGIFPVVYVKDI